MKKFLKVVLIGALLILIICVSIIAVKCITSKGKLFSGYYLAYEINNDRETCTIKEMVFTVVKEIEIPETIDGYRVTKIGRAFSNPSAGCVILTSVTIPDNVEWIAEKAFYNCNKLVQVENGVSYVDKWVVDCSPKVTSIALRENTIGIAESAFDECKYQDIVLPASVKYFGDVPLYRSLVYYGGTASDANEIDNAYSNQSFDFNRWHYFSESLPTSTDYAYWHYVDDVPSIWNVIEYASNDDGTCYVSRARVGGDFDIPNMSPNGETVINIGKNAFSYCYTLRSVTIPDSVTSIGSSSFYNCASLTSITIPDSITIIGDGAFAYCTSLASITIPDSVTCIDGAFSSCSSLTSITIPDGITSIGEETFYECSSLTNITIPDGVTYIGERAFADCSSLTTITIPNDVTSIGYAAFNGCGSLINVYITDLAKWCEISFDKTGANPLVYAQNLYLNGELITNIVIPEGAAKIGDFAFSGFCSLTSITIPNGVTSIGYAAFLDCSNLTSVTIPNSVTTICSSAFKDCSNLANITIPDSIPSISADLFEGCDKLIQIDNGVSYVDKWVIDYDKSVTIVTLRENTIGIGDEAFSNCRALQNITIPDSIMYIAADAFEKCPNLSYNQYGNAYYLGNNDNPHLVLVKTTTDDITSFEVDKGTKIIHASAFESCKLLKSVTIPNGVTSIGDSAFKDCELLKSITLPESVTYIGKTALDINTSRITYDGTLEQWNTIDKGTSLFWNRWGVTRTITVVCSDGRKTIVVD